ncbi:MAG: GNAT family N-acetyltransferase [Hyphomonadaceae bacterium]
MTSSAPETAPVVETERLILRPMAPGDLDDAFAMWSDPAVYRHIGGQPRSREEVWRRILGNAGSWALLGVGSWIVERRSDGAYLGQIGFIEAMREMSPAFAPGELELGWAFSPKAQGVGYAAEALAACIAWAERERPGRTMVCIIDPENAPSIRLAQRHGFQERCATTYHGAPTIQFERRADN